MKRKLAKQLDSALQMLYDLRIYGNIPTERQVSSYKEIYTILYDDGLLEPGPNGDEITGKGIAFMKKGGYIAQWRKDILTLILPTIGVIIGAIITWLLSR